MSLLFKSNQYHFLQPQWLNFQSDTSCQCSNLKRIRANKSSVCRTLLDGLWLCIRPKNDITSCRVASAFQRHNRRHRGALANQMFLTRKQAKSAAFVSRIPIGKKSAVFYFYDKIPTFFTIKNSKAIWFFQLQLFENSDHMEQMVLAKLDDMSIYWLHPPIQEDFLPSFFIHTIQMSASTYFVTHRRVTVQQTRIRRIAHGNTFLYNGNKKRSKSCAKRPNQLQMEMEYKLI